MMARATIIEVPIAPIAVITSGRDKAATFTDKPALKNFKATATTVVRKAPPTKETALALQKFSGDLRLSQKEESFG